MQRSAKLASNEDSAQNKPETVETGAGAPGYQSSFEQRSRGSSMMGAVTGVDVHRVPVNLQGTVEIFDCGCRISYSLVECGEFEGDLPAKPLLVPELVSCARHKAEDGHPARYPEDAKLVTVFHEDESFLNE